MTNLLSLYYPFSTIKRQFPFAFILKVNYIFIVLSLIIPLPSLGNTPILASNKTSNKLLLGETEFSSHNYLSSSLPSKETNEIEKLLNASDNLIYIDYIKSLSYAKKAKLKAEEEKNDDKKVEAYYYISKSLFLLGKYEECYHYVGKGLAEKTVKKNFFLTILFKELKVFCYARTHLLNNQLNECNVILDLINSKINLKDNIKTKLLISDIYTFLCHYYIEKEDYGTANSYIDKSIKIFESISDKDYFLSKRIYWHKAYVYLYKSKIASLQNNPDSAFKYLEMANNQTKQEQHKFTAPFLEAYGDYYLQKKQYADAIFYYSQAIKNKKELKKTTSSLNLKISQSYSLWGRPKEKEQYLSIFLEQHILEAKKEESAVSLTVEKMLKENEEYELRRDHEKKQITIIITVVSLLIFLEVANIFQQIKKKKKKVITEKEYILHKKELEITEKKEEIEELQKQVNESFEAVIQLAKDNSPQFWIRFREVYPDFYEKMLSVNPKIKTPELTFFAYLYLGFSNKEIADYTFVTIRGVETRRNRLRKKYNIPSDIDFSIWIRNLKKNEGTEDNLE